jgi:hypothetical protein
VSRKVWHPELLVLIYFFIAQPLDQRASPNSMVFTKNKDQKSAISSEKNCNLSTKNNHA